MPLADSATVRTVGFDALDVQPGNFVPEPSPESETVATPELRAPVLTLDEAINTCLQYDPVLRAGFEAIRQASADRVTASLKPNPEFEITQTLLPLTRPFTEERQGGPPQLDVMARYPIDWYLFGKRAAALVSAARGVRVSEAEYADLVRQRVTDTAVAYYDLLEAQALVDLAQQDVDNLLRVETITRVAVENQARPQVELSRVRLDRLNSQQSLRDAQRDLVAAQAALLALMGRTDWEPIGVQGPLESPGAIPEWSLEEAYGLAEANRPDIRALRWRVSQARADVNVENREAFPEVTPELGYTRQFQERAIGFPDANSWGVGLSMGLPLYNRNQGNRARASSVLTQTNHDLRAGLVELRAEIASITVELATARTNAVATAEEQLQLAEQVRDSINQAYEAGGRPLIDVLDAQRNYRDTFRNYINSRADYWRAVYRFNAAVGAQVFP